MAKTAAEEILGSALRQPEKERARIAEALIASLDATPDPEVEQVWQREVSRRLEELDSGAVQGLPWEEVRDRLDPRLPSAAT